MSVTWVPVINLYIYSAVFELYVSANTIIGTNVCLCGNWYDLFI